MLHLRGVSSDIVVDDSTGVPVILHWGAPLGDIDPASVSRALARRSAPATLDVVAPLSIVPEHGAGYPGRPGLHGHRRRGTWWAPRFTPGTTTPVDHGIEVTAHDHAAGLRLVTRLVLDDVLRVSVRLDNVGDDRYMLDGLTVSLPLPDHADELLTFEGRWARESAMRRRPWPTGTWTSENRAGRTSHEHPPLVVAGTAGFGEWHGEVWGIHVAWSANHLLVAECLTDGRRVVSGGELLHPGEIALRPGESYTTPEVIGSHAVGGLTPMSWGFHRTVRRGSPVRASSADALRPRPVVLNTWEAVYFDHAGDRLFRLAEVAAEVGVERFVLDDGWFGARRDDTRGLGDWWVSPEAHPAGLGPLVDRVRSLGMEFGIWVEPEMVNPDSDLYRDHPEWVLATPGYEPVTGRHQLVLDLGRDDAFAYVLGQLDTLLAAHDIAAVKWDMNRRHSQASGADGAAGTHRQTVAVNRLIDELRRRHPHVEFESCASGGGRIDLAILERTARVWASDTNDALERQLVQRGLSVLVPPEVVGAHIGPPRSHTTGRVHSVAFRAVTALFGHLGVEWDLLSATPDERRHVAEAVALYRRFRSLVHGGDVVRFDTWPDGAGHAHGVYAPDRRSALVAAVQLATGPTPTPPALRLPGLRDDTRYVLRQVALPGARLVWDLDGIELTGRQLAAHGVHLPALFPESALLVHVEAP